MPNGTAHRMRRHMIETVLLRQLPGQRAVGGGLPIGNLTQQRPYLLPERGTDGVKRRREVRILPAKVTVQPALGLKQNGRLLLLVFRGERIGKVLFAVEPQPGQAGFVCGKQNAAQRGIVVHGVHHGGYLELNESPMGGATTARIGAKQKRKQALFG